MYADVSFPNVRTHDNDQKQQGSVLMRQGRQGKRTDPDVRQWIEDRAIEGWGPSQIERKLLASDFADRAVGIRTIQAIRTDALRRDSSGAWSSAVASAEELAAVLPVLAWLLERTAIRGLTVAEASALLTLTSYAPDLPVGSRFWVARRLAAARESGGPTTDLDQYLAFAPWQDGGARYSKAFCDGKISNYLRFGGGVPEAPETTERIRNYLVAQEVRRRSGTA